MGQRSTTTRLRFADSEVAALSVRYHAGASLERLSREIGRDRRVIRRTLLEAGVPLRTRHPLPVDQHEGVAEQYRAGTSLRALAERTGCSVGAIRRALLRAGVTLRPPGPVPYRGWPVIRVSDSGPTRTRGDADG